MVSTTVPAQVIVRRYNGSRAWTLWSPLADRSSSSDVAIMKWARIESKSYNIPGDFRVELITPHPTQGLDSAL
jgi:hypothetical protein